MRRRTPGLVLALAGGLLLLGTPGAADEAQHDDHGWWWRAQTGALDVPPPPFVPEDGLAVGRDADGATAISALRFEVGVDTLATATLTLVEDDEQSGELAELRACAVTTSWSGAEAGVWDERPEADCDAGQAGGVRDDDSGTWEFDVSLLAEDGVVDVVVLPDAGGDEPDDGQDAPLPADSATADEEEGGAPFQVAFEPPDDDALEVGGGVGGDFDGGGGFEADDGFEDDDHDAAPATGGSDQADDDGAPEVADSNGLDTAPSTSSGSDESGDEQQRPAAPEVADTEGGEPPADDAVALTPPDEGGEVGDEGVVAAPVGFGGQGARRLAGLVSLAALVVAAVLFLSDRGAVVAGIPGLRPSRIVRPDVARSRLPELSPGHRGGQDAVGGIGRFVRSREGDPPSL